MELLSKRGRWWLVGAIIAAILLSQLPAWPSRLEALAVCTMFALGLAGAYLKKLTCITDGIGFNVDGLSAKCDLQVNSSGTPTTLTAASGAGPGGGTIEIFAPQVIPYA